MKNHKLTNKDKDTLANKDTLTKYSNMREVFDYKMSLKDHIQSILWYTPLRVCKKLYYDIKYGIQRLIKGYDDSDIFNFWQNFCSRNKKILKELSANHYGYPVNMTNEEYTEKLNMLSSYLEKIENIEDNYIEKGMTLKEVYQLQTELKNKFMTLFNDLFFDLWD